MGSLHPRTLLSALGPDDERFITELAWREFYASVLWFWPESARDGFNARMSGLAFDEGPDADAGCSKNGARGGPAYPIIDAGMRQLKAEAWMHNRVRMLVASFLVKDLHLHWRRGARHFMRGLSSTGISPATSTDGSGRRGQVPTPRPTSASSIP